MLMANLIKGEVIYVKVKEFLAYAVSNQMYLTEDGMDEQQEAKVILDSEKS